MVVRAMGQSAAQQLTLHAKAPRGDGALFDRMVTLRNHKPSPNRWRIGMATYERPLHATMSHVEANKDARKPFTYRGNPLIFGQVLGGA